MRYLLLCCLLLTGCITVDPNAERAAEKARQVENDRPKGEFATIPSEKTQRAVLDLQNGNYHTLEAVLTDPNGFEPPVLFALAQQLFDQGEIEPALFWFYTAQLRARSDANKSLDPTTQAGITELTRKYCETINRYAHSHPHEVSKAVRMALEWDKQTKRYYNVYWVALYGADSRVKEKVEFRPREQWNQIDEQTRLGFEKGLQQLLDKLGLPSGG